MNLRHFVCALLLAMPCGAGASPYAVLPVSIDGRALRFILDTGTGATAVVWSETAERLGLHATFPDPRRPLTPGRMRAGESEPVEVHLLGQQFKDVHLAVIALPPYATPEFDGLIGWPAVRRDTWLFRLAESRIILDRTVPAEARHWLRVRVVDSLDTLGLELPLTGGGRRGVLLVDTGDTGGVKLAPDGWARWRATHPKAPLTIDGFYSPGSGVIIRKEGLARSLALGPLTLTDVTVEKADPTAVAMGGPDYLGSIGLQALRRLNLVVDGAGNLAYLEPRRDQTGPIAYNRLGAVFVPEAGNARRLVARVAPGTPAERAGIRDGDELVVIEHIHLDRDRPIPGGVIRRIRELLQSPAGTRLHLVTRHGSVLRTSTVTLREILGP